MIGSTLVDRKLELLMLIGNSILFCYKWKFFHLKSRTRQRVLECCNVHPYAWRQLHHMPAYEYTQHHFIGLRWLLYVLPGRLEKFAVSHDLQLNSITFPSPMCPRAACCDIVSLRQLQYSNRFQLLCFGGRNVWLHLRVTFSTNCT
jgi:hypothetical protein